MLKKILFVLLSVQAVCLCGQNPWTDFPEQNIAAAKGARRYIIPRQYRTVQLDLQQLQPVLAAAPERFTATAADQVVTLTLPLPDGRYERFYLSEASVMEPGLQAKFPEIRCYSGTGVDDPTATLKCDLTPQGFHAMIRSARRGTIFIDPYRRDDRDHYIVYDKKDFQSKKEPFVCALDGEIGQPRDLNGPVADLQGDCTFRRYRLALACTGEYAIFQGGTQILTLAAMNTTINRVNGIYERDLAISFQLIANNNLLIFLDPATDGFSNGNGTTMLGQNQTKCTNIIGSTNYDIGHVFSTAGGGVAGLGVVCGNSVKARGVTGIDQPVGDPFDVDYVSHEMGHQLGANHCFNNTCDGNIYPATAFEPGSGSTIMGYAGVCDPSIQDHSDAYFHAISLQEIGAYTTVSQGNVCPVKVNIGNSAPIVSAGADYVIPKSTPFSLTATGNDANGDALTYCWEQMDNQQATMPPVATNTGGPMFRSFFPKASPTRHFPRLEDLTKNINSTWEELPAVARTMNFRVTARDNHAGGGCTAEDNLVLTVAATAGPFVVTAPNTVVSWYVGESKTVTWDVAQTNVAPVSCTQVRILLSTDGGLSYPVVLANAVSNDGSAPVDVPNILSDSCRVRVQGVGNVFFDISNENFAIKLPPAPTFLLEIPSVAGVPGAPSDAVQVCQGEPLLFNTLVTGISGFSGPVQLSINGIPPGSSAQISANPVAPGNSADVDITGLTLPGIYPMTLQGVSDTLMRTRQIELTVLNGPPSAPVLLNPADGSGNAVLNQTLNWTALPDALSYQVQAATNPSFNAGTIILDKTVNTTTAMLSGLDTARVYYWRVKATNACGQSDLSPVFAFQTGKPECGFTFNSGNVPVNISTTKVVTISSVLNIPVGRHIADLNLSTTINHTWVGDLVARLISPSGKSALLFDQPGFPISSSGCGGDNLNVTLDDEATQTAADLENTCNDLPAISGTFRPIESLGLFDNENAQGAWKLEISDNFSEDGGALTAWSLKACFLDTVAAGKLLLNNPLTVPSGLSAGIGISHLILEIESGNPADGVFTLLSVPQHGTLKRNGSALAVGGTFTQNDILTGLLTYTSNGDNAGADAFDFDALDAGTGNWVHDSTFHIQILQNDLTITATVTKAIQCPGDANGEITAVLTGGTPPYQYSLNGGAPQFFNVFENLPAGTYTVVATDQIGFTAASNPVVIADPQALQVTAAVTDDDITATATGGTGALQYSIDGQFFQSSNLFKNLPNGNYTVSVRDANGCTATANAVIAVTPLSVLVNIATSITCAGSATGAISASATGGVPPLSYSVNGIDFQSGTTFGGLKAGTYTVVVKDDSGNTATAGPVTLTDPPALQANATVTDDDVTVNATGGTGALQYSIDGQFFQGSNFFENQPNGFYTVTVRDANGCTVTLEVVVAVDALLAELKIEVNNACAGNAAGKISAKAAGGVAPYTYSLNGGNFQSDSIFSGLSAGVYTVVVKDNSGNTATTNAVTLVDPPALTIAAIANLNVVTATASGGTAPLQYSIDGENFQTGNAFGQLVNGVYTVTVRDAAGCTATATATVAVPDLKILNIIVGGINCAGETGTLTVSAGGGIPPYAFSIDGSAYQPDSILENVGAGVHTISVRDAAGSVVSIPAFMVAAPPLLTAIVTVQKNDALVQASGGTGPYTYTLNSGQPQPSGVFNNLVNGAYMVLVTDANGCTKTVEFSIDYTGLSAQVATIDPSCFGSSDGSVAIVVMGGTPPYTFSGLPMNNLPAGTYTVLIVDAGGDSLETIFSLFNPPLLAATASVSGDTISVVASGGTGNLQYSLNGVNYQNTPIFPGLPNGTYNVWVRDENGCIETVTNLVVNKVGTIEPAQAWGLSVQPNPSPGWFRISLQHAPAGTLRADIFDTAGRQIRQQLYEPLNGLLSTTLDLSGLPAGVYWLRLTSGTQVGAVRLMVQ